MNEKKWFYTYIGLFFSLNIMNTYFVTTQTLNRYLFPFRLNGFLELNSIIGNIAALSILLLIGFLVFKSNRKRIIFLTTLTLLLNIAIFSIGIFTKYYQSMFSIYELTLFNNPAASLAGSILVQAFTELYVYFRIVVFIPFVVLLTVGLLHDKKYRELVFIEKYQYQRYTALMGICVSLVFSIATLGIVKTHMDRVWPISAERSLYGVQSAGLYNFYLGQMMGFNLSNTDSTVPSLSIYKQYNKNQDSYTNMFGETFSNELSIDQATALQTYPALNDNKLNGVFEGKNLVVFHLETFNHFLLDESGPYFDHTFYPSLKGLLDQSFVLNNFYTNVGLGNSSDAEFSAMTGLYPQGDTTIYWNYRKEQYVFEALPKLFDGYYKASLHGDVGIFYNRMSVHEKMFGFNDYFYFDENEKTFTGTKNGYHVFDDLVTKNTPESPWLSDYALLDWTKRLADTNGKHFLFPITIQPHTPYEYDPFPNQFTKQDIDVESSTLKYLNYETYYDKFFDEFLEFAKTQTNTVYLFYADHGSGIPKSDLETIKGRELTTLEYKNEIIKTLSFIYAPDDTKMNEPVPTGTLKGVQNLVRSQVDIYRTIVELFDLETTTQYYGVNLLSDESTFSIDTRAFDIVTDDYFIMGKYLNSDKASNDMNTLHYTTTPVVEPFELYQDLITYKKRMDLAIKFNLYQYLKK